MIEHEEREDIYPPSVLHGEGEKDEGREEKRERNNRVKLDAERDAVVDAVGLEPTTFAL